MTRFATILAAVSVLGAAGLAACDEDRAAVDIDLNDEDFLDEDDAVEITTPDGRIEIEEDGGIDVDN